MDSVGSIEKSIPLSLAPPSSYNVLRLSSQPLQSLSLQDRNPLNSCSTGPYSLAPFAGFDED